MQFMSQLLTVKTALKPFVHWHFVQNIKLCPNFFVYFFAKSEKMLTFAALTVFT